MVLHGTKRTVGIQSRVPLSQNIDGKEIVTLQFLDQKNAQVKSDILDIFPSQKISFHVFPFQLGSGESV